MTPVELISEIRIDQDSLSSLKRYFQFQLDKNNFDQNQAFRTSVVDELLKDFSQVDVQLIRQLLVEELKCDAEIGRHDNLYQIVFLLYRLGNLEDVYKIYSVKFNSRNMDSNTMIDREMLYLNHKIDDVINFVKLDLAKNEVLKIQYPNILNDLLDLKKNPDYESEESYFKFINGYFFGHQTEPIENFTPIKKRLQKWWKIKFGNKNNNQAGQGLKTKR